MQQIKKIEKIVKKLKEIDDIVHHYAEIEDDFSKYKYKLK